MDSKIPVFIFCQGKGIASSIADKVIDNFIGLFAAAGVHSVQAAQHKSYFVAHGGGKYAGIICSQQHKGNRALISEIQPAQ